MKDINVATVFGEEIEKQWRNHVPRECVFQLRLIAEQVMTLEKAMNSQQKLIEKLMQFAVVEGNAMKVIKQMQADIERQFGNSPLNTEKPDDE